MKALFLDAYALSVPHPIPGLGTEQNKQHLESYLVDLLSWQSAIDNDCFRLLSNADAVQCLSDSDDYPLWERIDTRLREFQLDDEYQTRDIFRVLESLLTKSFEVEGELGLTDVLVDGFRVAPEGALGTRPARYVEHFARLGAIMQIYSSEETCLGPMVITRAIPASIVNASLSGEILEITGNPRDREGHTWPTLIGIVVPLATNFFFAVKTSDALALWGQGTDQSLRTALTCLIADKHNYDNEQCEEALAFVEFGEEFIATAKALGFLHDKKKVGRLSRTVVEVILGLNLPKVHWLRAGHGPNEPQIQRDQFSAWRRDIDDEFHLHYWKCGRRIVLANVVVHNDLSIL